MARIGLERGSFRLEPGNPIFAWPKVSAESRSPPGSWPRSSWAGSHRERDTELDLGTDLPVRQGPDVQGSLRAPNCTTMRREPVSKTRCQRCTSSLATVPTGAWKSLLLGQGALHEESPKTPVRTAPKSTERYRAWQSPMAPYASISGRYWRSHAPTDTPVAKGGPPHSAPKHLGVSLPDPSALCVGTRQHQPPHVHPSRHRIQGRQLGCRLPWPKLSAQPAHARREFAATLFCITSTPSAFLADSP